MKINAKRILSIALAAATAMSLSACSQEVAESSFDNPLPWHTTAASYEKLDYSIAVYNTEESEAEDERKKIGDGTLTFILEEGAEAGGYTAFDMSFSVKYDNTELAGADAGLTDTITSRVVFEPNSLAVKSMDKEVKLAARKDQTNLSYKIHADYFGEHVATFKYTEQDNAAEKTLNLPGNACRDNEMMFLLARAQELGTDKSSNFKMINLFDSFNNGKIVEYRMAIACSSERKIDVGDWVKDYGVPNVEENQPETQSEENNEVDYSVNCYTTTIKIDADKHGPSYYVYYAKDEFKTENGAHKKLPVKIDYSSYNGAKPHRHTTYTLTSCTFVK